MTRPNVEVILLAAGASTRMQGVDKLMENVGGQPLLRHCAQVSLSANVDRVVVVLPPENNIRENALNGLGANVVRAQDAQDGMAASIKAGLSAISRPCDAVIIALADMPEVNTHHLNSLIEAFDPSRNREICRPLSEDGTPGNPVLFGRRFFDSLSALTGEQGGRDVIRKASDYQIYVPSDGHAVTMDLDTPEDWANWRNKNKEQ